MGKLSGRFALVTGSARRLGIEITLKLARAGCDVLAHYGSTSETTVHETQAELRAQLATV